MKIAMILSLMIVFPFAARSDVPVVEIITPPITIERTASVDVAIRRVVPMYLSILEKLPLVPLFQLFVEGLSPLTSSSKEVLEKSFFPSAKPIHNHPQKSKQPMRMINIFFFISVELS